MKVKQVFINVWIFYSVAAVIIYVSAPYSRTGFYCVVKDPDFDVDDQRR